MTQVYSIAIALCSKLLHSAEMEKFFLQTQVSSEYEGAMREAWNQSVAKFFQIVVRKQQKQEIWPRRMMITKG
jgi:hypothetical protein